MILEKIKKWIIKMEYNGFDYPEDVGIFDKYKESRKNKKAFKEIQLKNRKEYLDNCNSKIDKNLNYLLKQYDKKNSKKIAKKRRKFWIDCPYVIEENKKIEYELYGKYLSKKDKINFFGKYRGERMIYLTVGISGSGKSTYCRNHAGVIICPDEIRDKVFGDINNQTHNRTVFDIAYYTLEKFLKSNNKEDIYFDATSLHQKTIKTFCDFCLDKASIKPTILVFTDSNNLSLCCTRIKNDLTNGINRSNVSYAVLKKQYDNFKKLNFNEIENEIKSIESIIKI